jgi:hypothetical protein
LGSSSSWDVLGKKRRTICLKRHHWGTIRLFCMDSKTMEEDEQERLVCSFADFGLRSGYMPCRYST